MSDDFQRPDDSEDFDPAAFAAEFTQMCMNKYTSYGLPQELLARSFVVHGALMTVAIVGAKQCAAELRTMADQIELGNMPTQGRG